jgi:small subunit ribosomal protein S14
MTSSDWRKILKQLKSKPAVMQKFINHCKPKERKHGIACQKCERCGRFGAHINSYGLHLCRQCFREMAEELGFTKYS